MADVFISHLEWTGPAKGPTRDPATFSRDLNLTVDAITLPMSSAPSYRGDPSRANPEQLFVASLSACQALTYLFLAAKNGVAVVGYTDDAEGRLGVAEGKIRMSRVTLRPQGYHVGSKRPGSARARVGREGARRLLRGQLRVAGSRDRADLRLCRGAGTGAVTSPRISAMAL